MKFGAHFPKSDPEVVLWSPMCRPPRLLLFQVLARGGGEGNRLGRVRGRRVSVAALRQELRAGDVLATEVGFAGSGTGFSSGLRCCGRDPRGALPIQKPLASFPTFAKTRRLLFFPFPRALRL